MSPQIIAGAFQEIARRAGEIIMRHYRSGVESATKSDASPVTAADREAETAILSDLSALAPSIPAISEEAASLGRIPALRRAEEAFFLVDPLDGTRELLRRNGEFTVNIALIEDGRVTAGVVHAPERGRLFFGGWGQAFERGEGGAGREKILRARVVPAAPVVLVSRSLGREARAQTARHLNARRVMAAGSSLKFCLIAAGEADIYPRNETTMAWDTAAGQAVLEGAGGAVTGAAGEALRYLPRTGRTRLGDWRNPPFTARGRER